MLPVYSQGESGFDVIWGPSGGYLVGFVLAAYVIGRLAEHGADRRPLPAFVAFALAQLSVFVIGVPWLKVATDIDWGTAIHQGFTVFIIGGLIKAALAAVFAPAAWRLVRRVDRG
jgi:biotin transport system substrate-specific component